MRIAPEDLAQPFEIDISLPPERLGAGAISLVVDPFAVALNESLSCGVPGGDGVPLPAESVELPAAITRVFGLWGSKSRLPALTSSFRLPVRTR
ncbi:hypothetical protein AB0F52_44070 [Amycolatopsis sp. NPDC024027]|uniref:hypothetical protein n=1 Tax=Amycolatopsis sp. NPDC024027 TaxID=3154327 RepID=UPI00340BB25E